MRPRFTWASASPTSAFFNKVSGLAADTIVGKRKTAHNRIAREEIAIAHGTLVDTFFLVDVIDSSPCAASGCPVFFWRRRGFPPGDVYRIGKQPPRLRYPIPHACGKNHDTRRLPWIFRNRHTKIPENPVFIRFRGYRPAHTEKQPFDPHGGNMNPGRLAVIACVLVAFAFPIVAPALGPGGTAPQPLTRSEFFVTPPREAPEKKHYLGPTEETRTTDEQGGVFPPK